MDYVLGVTDMLRIIEDISHSLAGDKSTNQSLDAIRHLTHDLLCIIEGGVGKDLWVQNNIDWLIREGHYESSN